MTEVVFMNISIEIKRFYVGIDGVEKICSKSF